MIRFGIRFLAAIARAAGLALVVIVPVNAASPALTAEQVQRLKSGDALVSVEPDDGDADGHIEAAIDIPASPHSVWTVMLDCARTVKFVQHMSSCTVTQRDVKGTWDIREHHSRWLSMLPETISVFRSDYVTDKEIRFERVSGSLRYLKGAWQLEPLYGGKQTRLFYSVRIGISAPVPRFMIRSQIEADVPKLLTALRKEVMSSAQ
jgi:ribosome-associated toxin RatA of RatAB toxin-antitoxin module